LDLWKRLHACAFQEIYGRVSAQNKSPLNSRQLCAALVAKPSFCNLFIFPGAYSTELHMTHDNAINNNEMLHTSRALFLLQESLGGKM
jgi:hypothetical protein